ncbi:MAG: GNAT family N-acetyltransferase [Emcibacteraceae bacterium]|nr:GNAT family N-acetyltransferase [Emcibacteraceae bacterium]
MNNAGISFSKLGSSASEMLSFIHLKSFGDKLDKGWSTQEIKDLFDIPNTNGYVLSVSNEPCGFAIIRGVIDEVEIITFCILPKQCHNGYATLLLEWIIKDLQSNSFKKMFLEVRENNVAAIGLYEKCAFDIIGRRKGYYQINKHQKIDALVMQRDLSK